MKPEALLKKARLRARAGKRGNQLLERRHPSAPKLQLPGPMALAVHESGHAVARLVLSETHYVPPIEEVSVDPLPEDNALGIVRGERRTKLSLLGYLDDALASRPGMLDAARESARQDIIDTLAGPIAELRWRHWLTVAMSRPNYLSLVLAVDATVPVNVDRFKQAEVAIGNDALVIATLLRWIAPADPSAFLGACWDETSALIEREWRGIVAVARMLRLRRTMSGEDFEAAWQTVRRQPRVPPH
ncbi:hypothetical protein GXW78_20210 [Roseomonas terrae]|uniref:Peptidase M41 domain-containing protein n=1 Tax=Neoroseomonas terrae TaxID=424799 RepID=A0ABS5ELU4_9PROT|nr:hypothetical protein [Neoroseomonas terrae]MBR0652000.1 hypothetical protein [Neoroseomonas terrae]